MGIGIRPDVAHAMAQTLGAGLALTGVFLLWGLGWMLLVGGVAAMVISVIVEMRADPRSPSLGSGADQEEG